MKEGGNDTRQAVRARMGWLAGQMEECIRQQGIPEPRAANPGLYLPGYSGTVHFA